MPCSHYTILELKVKGVVKTIAYKWYEALKYALFLKDIKAKGTARTRLEHTKEHYNEQW